MSLFYYHLLWYNYHLANAAPQVNPPAIASISNNNNMLGEQRVVADKAAAMCHEEDPSDEWAIDDVSGAPLDPVKVKAARQEEIDYIRKMGLYVKVPITECFEKTGKKPIGVRWIDVNKQDANNPLYRSRLVGKDFNTHNDMSLYAATPPIEALRLILHIASTNRENKSHF